MKPLRYRIGRIWSLFCISFVTVEASNKGPMLPRRGYEPVDDAEDDSPQDETRDYGASGLRSGYSSIPSNGPSDTNADQREPAPSSADGTSRKAVGFDSDDTEGSMTVRVLDVQGQTYKLRVRPETRVGELKARLLEIAGVEIARQRIIWSGQILKDSDTLSSRKVIDGAAMHLFQRPKNAPVVSGIGTSNAPQPNGRTEIPSMMLQVQGSTASDEFQNQGLLDEHWEVEGPRRTMRFLASVLILISIMQFLECLSRVSAAMASSGGGKGDNARLVLSPDEWSLVRDRTISSVVGIVVGLLGVYGALSLSTRIIRLYLVGLATCFVIAMYIQLEFLFDVSTGKVPFDDYDTGSSSDHHPDDGDEDDGNDVDDDEGHDSSHGSATERTLYLKIFNALIGVLLSGGIWVICLVRIYFVRMEIEIYMENRERQLREIREEEERQRVSTSRLEEGEAVGSASLTS